MAESEGDEMIDSPCKGCTDRHKGCHAGCPDYLDYKEAKEREKEAKRSDVDTPTIARQRQWRKNSKKQLMDDHDGR